MSNPTAVITGGSVRIGAEICRELHRDGMNVIIHYHTSSDAAKTLEKELNELRPGSAQTLHADLKSVDACTALIEEACQIYERLDVLINNASAFYATPLDSLNEDQWDELIGVNLRAPLFLAKAAASYLSRQHGNIINLIDIHAERPLKDHTVYCVSKTGLIMLTRSLAKELGPDIRVNAVSPGAILWPEDISEKDKEEILAKTVLKRQGRCEDIAKAVLYFIRDAHYATGQVLAVDGGRTLFS